CDIQRRRIDDAAVDGDAALRDPLFGVAARGKPCARDHLGDPLAGFLFARWTRRPRFEIRRALAIGATAAECRTLGKDPAVVFIVAARAIVTRFTARMFLPAGAAFGPSSVALAIAAGAVEFRAIPAIFARTIELRTLAKRAITRR